MPRRKRKAAEPLAPGTKFKTPKGVDTVVMDTKSAHGKLQARLACSVDGCKRTHVREASDWWQCHRCRWHAEKRG